MLHLILLLSLGVGLGVCGWQLIVWVGEVRDKTRKYQAASAYSRERKLPLLVVGGPWGNKRARHWLRMPAHGSGDVCVDIDHRAIKGHAHGVIANATRLPFPDKSFGAAFSSHLLEHLPTIADARKALAELSRIADVVFIAYPSRQSIAGWIIPAHHLWVWQRGNLIYLKQRGGSAGSNCREEFILESVGEGP